jgi:hypothetical protein
MLRSVRGTAFLFTPVKGDTTDEIPKTYAIAL